MPYADFFMKLAVYMLQPAELSIRGNTDTTRLDIPFWYKFQNNFLLSETVSSKDFFLNAS